MSPVAPMHRCPRCRTPVSGRCSCRDQHGTRRSSTEDGYGYRWQRFIQQFRKILIAEDIVPSCGAALPNGPRPAYSQCQRAGRLQMLTLQLDHSPPLTREERKDWLKVCDPLRVIFYCHSCHSAKTGIESKGGG
jgi:hypothetical protein